MKYKSIIILQEKINNEKITNLINKIENLINEYGVLIKTQKIGKKQLAYSIKGNNYGFYIEFDFVANKNFISELDRIFRTTDEILKFITIKMEEK